MLCFVIFILATAGFRFPPLPLFSFFLFALIEIFTNTFQIIMEGTFLKFSLIAYQKIINKLFVIIPKHAIEKHLILYFILL